MSIILDFDQILFILNKYIIDSKRSDLKRHEIKFITPKLFEREEIYAESENVICLQLVSKLYLLHDFVSLTDKLISKCLIKRMNKDEYLILRQFFNESDFTILRNVINNLSDTKYVMVLSNLAYEIIEKLIAPETITKAFWYEDKCPMIIITNNVFEIQQKARNIKQYLLRDLKSNKNTENFETQLLQLLSAVTDTSRTILTVGTYTFWIIKINKLMFGVLIPRYESKMKCLINVWPIVPAASFFNSTKYLNNLKVPDCDKAIFHSIASCVRQNDKLNVINLKKEMLKGITLPMLIQNRVNMNCLYMTFFFEYLHENEDYQFALPMSDSVTYLRCKHCEIIFSNIFEFVRHWWTIKHKMIFRCHLCDERMNRLLKLGHHYRRKHLIVHGKQSRTASERVILSKVRQRNRSVDLSGVESRNKDLISGTPLGDHRDSDNMVICSRRYSNENVKPPKKRKCPFCNVTKVGLHFMRLHLRSEHMPEILQKTLIKKRNSVKVHKEYSMDRQKYQYLNLKINPNRIYRDEFQSLFDYDVLCPLCNDTAKSFVNPTVFLTHLARDHCNAAVTKNSDNPSILRKKRSERRLNINDIGVNTKKHKVSKVKQATFSIDSVPEYNNTISDNADHVICDEIPFDLPVAALKTKMKSFKPLHDTPSGLTQCKGDNTLLH